MSLRSVFSAINRNRGRGIDARWSARGFNPGAVTRDYVEESAAEDGGEGEGEIGDNLRSRIFRLRLPKRSATNVIHRWVSEGNSVTDSELREISRELRRRQSYKHALELTEWMVSHEGFQLSDSDYAERIDLMTKVFGVHAAERYFEGLPPSAKTSETYTALLHSYAAAKYTDQAEQFYQRILESNIPVGALAYNEMMTLYISVGMVEKVSSVVVDMKQRHIEPDLFTYNLWVSSLAATMDIDRVHSILDEMSQVCYSKDDWLRYIKLAKIYTTTGSFANSESDSMVAADKGITQREWITYDFLVILHAGLGNKDQLDQIWKSLRMTKQKMTNRNYIGILSSYLLLRESKDVSEVIDQWMQSTTTEFDISVCKKLSNALQELGLTDEADTFRMLLMQKGHFLDEKSNLK